MSPTERSGFFVSDTGERGVRVDQRSGRIHVAGRAAGRAVLMLAEAGADAGPPDAPCGLRRVGPPQWLLLPSLLRCMQRQPARQFGSSVVGT